ncbi:MAG: hypothetical protein V2I76_13940 [Roseobacter sp.]|jgi:hypothetical protein|nr:hypothetical protein [Roseobacter sp.]
MSAPDTNPEKQVKRHKPSLWGIALAALIPAVIAVIAIGWGEDLAEDDATDAAVAQDAAQ